MNTPFLKAKSVLNVTSMEQAPAAIRFCQLAMRHLNTASAREELQARMNALLKMSEYYSHWKLVDAAEKEPQMHFTVECICGGKLNSCMPWIYYPHPLMFTCAKCGRSYHVHVSEPTKHK